MPALLSIAFVPSADTAGPGFAAVLGVAYLFVLSLIVVVEALILWRLGWAGFRRSFLDSFVMNVVSSLAGIVLLILQLDIARAWVFVLAFVISVALEAAVLALVRWSKPGRALRASLVANVATYAAIAVVLLLTR